MHGISGGCRTSTVLVAFKNIKKTITTASRVVTKDFVADGDLCYASAGLADERSACCGPFFYPA